MPARGDALHRLEADSGLTHRPLTHLTDRQASNLVDPWATVLWAHHQKRLLANLGELTLAAPKSDVARRDPMALRGLAILLLALGVGIAWEQAGSRLMASVAPQPRGTADLLAITVEAWITPPDYTRLAPIALKADPAAKPVDDAVALTPIEVPVGSKLLVQIQGLGAAANLSANNASKPMEQLDSETQRAELVLKQGDKIGIAGGGLDVGWPISLKQDMAPSAVLQEPRVTERAVLQVAYGGKDDFGVTDMRLVITLGKESVELPLAIQGADPREVKGASLPGPDRASVGRTAGRAARGGARRAGPDRRLRAGRHDPAGAQVLSSGGARHHRAAQAPGRRIRTPAPWWSRGDWRS